MMMVRPSCAELFDQRYAGFQLGRVQSREPFVEQQHLRIGGERPSQLDPFLVDIGQRGYRRIRAGLEPDPAKEADCIVVQFAAPAPAMAEHAAGCDIFQHRQAGQHPDDLKRAGDAFDRDLIRGHRSNLVAVEPNVPGAWLERAGNQVEHGGLAGAVWPDQAKHLVLGKLERNPVDCDQPAEQLADLANRQRNFRGRARHVRPFAPPTRLRPARAGSGLRSVRQGRAG